MTVKVSPELQRIMAASRQMPRAEPVGHMRERIAVAINGSRPNFFKWTPDEVHRLYFYQNDKMRQMYEDWADRLLFHFDAYGLEIVDKRAED
jgi:hypothetical protein